MGHNSEVVWVCAKTGVGIAKIDEMHTGTINRIASANAFQPTIQCISYCSNEKIRRQSFFMLITIQPLSFASSMSDWGKTADVGCRKALCGTVGVLTILVVVQDEHCQSCPTTRFCVLQHLLIARGVAKRRDGPPADHEMDTLGFASLVVVEEELRLFGEHGLAACVITKGVTPADPTTCSGGMP